MILIRWLCTIHLSSQAIYRARVSFAHSIVRGPLFRYFPTISGSGVANRKGHSWSACKSVAPCKSACNSPDKGTQTREASQGGKSRGGKERGMKEELRSTRIANYLSKQAAVDTGGRSR